jgi:hypothetical protein
MRSLLPDAGEKKFPSQRTKQIFGSEKALRCHQEETPSRKREATGHDDTHDCYLKFIRKYISIIWNDLHISELA